MDTKSNEITEYKIEVFVPQSAKGKVIDAILNIGIGKIGKYHNCISCSIVQSSWTANEDSAPYLGESGKDYQIEEIKIETRCPVELLDTAIRAIKKSHPYECVCVNIMPILSIGV